MWYRDTEAITVGDGANDLEMLAAAGMGVAFRAKPVVAEAARARIDHGDLTALLYIQGYTAAEFVEPGRIPKTTFAAASDWRSQGGHCMRAPKQSPKMLSRCQETQALRRHTNRHCIVGSARSSSAVNVHAYVLRS